MIIQVFDTETTGLPEFKKRSDAAIQPHIVQLGALLAFDDGEITDKLSVLVKPDTWTWDDSDSSEDAAFLTHGITMERAMDEGIEEENALIQYLQMWRKCDLRVAHNTTFDNRIIRIAICRYMDKPFADLYDAAPFYCTMLRSKKILDLPGPRGTKNPKLEEAYRHFAGKELEDAHDAMADTMGCLEVFLGIQKDVKEGTGNALS